MAAERKENSVLFTLKELKDITADQPDPAPAAAAAPKAKPKRKVSSFIDDAESLLADIRDSVDEEAAAEARRLEDEKRLAEEAEKQRQAEEEARIKAEMQARVAAEEARRRGAAEEREARAAAIDRAERIARGEIVDEPEPLRPQIVQAAPQPQAPQGRGTGFYLVVVGLPVLCLTAVAIALIIKPADQPQITADGTAAAAVAPAPVAPPEPVAAIEEIEEDAGVPDATPDAEPKKVASKKRRAKRKKPKDGAGGDDKKGTGKKKLKINLGGDKGGITF